MMPSLEQMRADHVRYGHYDQASAIAVELRRRYPALEIFGPEDAESGRYVAVYVRLVPGLVSLRLNLTYSGLNQHGYNLQPLTEKKADRTRFIDYMTRNHPSIQVKKSGYYAKLPGWIRANVKNDDYDAIARHVQRALNFVSGTAHTEDNQ